MVIAQDETCSFESINSSIASVIFASSSLHSSCSFLAFIFAAWTLLSGFMDLGWDRAER